MIVKRLNVEQFYRFFGFFKEVIPVMKVIADKHSDQGLDPLEAMAATGLRNSILRTEIKLSDLDKYRKKAKEEVKEESKNDEWVFNEDECSVCYFERK